MARGGLRRRAAPHDRYHHHHLVDAGAQGHARVRHPVAHPAHACVEVHPMKLTCLGLALAFALAPFSFGRAAQAQAPRDTALVIHAGRLVDGTSNEALLDQGIVVSGGRITAVGPWAGVRRPAGARVLDLTGATVLPGLIDNHTHVLLQGDITSDDYDKQLLYMSIPYRAILGARNAQRALMQGFTALRDLETEGAMYADVDIKRAINGDEHPGARDVRR